MEQEEGIKKKTSTKKSTTTKKTSVKKSDKEVKSVSKKPNLKTKTVENKTDEKNIKKQSRKKETVKQVANNVKKNTPRKKLDVKIADNATEMNIKSLEEETKTNKEVSEVKVEVLSEKNDKVSSYSIMQFVIISTCAISLVGGYVIGGIINSSFGLGKFNRLQEAYKLLKDNYLYNINDYNIEKTLIDGLAIGLDDSYSKYYASDDIAIYNKDMYGKYNGIGVELMTNSDNQVIVSKVFKNTPASTGGVAEQDIVTHVNGILVTNNVEASKIISDSSKVTLSILRADSSFTIDLAHSEISSENIYVKNYDDIVYMRVASFYSGAYKEVENNIKTLKLAGKNKIILDLRYAYKGIGENEVIDMASLFVPNEQVLYQVKKDKSINLVKSTNKYILGLEVIIIQNNTTRMFGELFTSIIKETNPNIKIIGNNTAGETSMTKSYTLKDKSILVMPTTKWLTSKGEDLTNIGVAPTEYISIGEKYYNSLSDDDDNQLQTALNYLK